MDPSNLKAYKTCLNSFLSSATGDVTKYANLSVHLDLPVVENSLLHHLCEDVKTIFQEEPVLLQILSPCIIVGDIHGHILDLFRIIHQFGIPSGTSQKYVFLGDLIDRGEFSVETIILIFLLKVVHPKNIYIIRGNHEFEYLCSQCGFLTQLIQTYPDPVLPSLFIQSFSQMPMACLINQKILCVHGGIGPSLFGIPQIKAIERPLYEFGDDNIDSLLWSDPSEKVDFFEPSNRGTGYLFGENALNDFITDSGIDLLVRGHECVLGGCEYAFHNHLITVFSASNYCGLINNQSGILKVLSPSKTEIQVFPPLPYLSRKEVFNIQPIMPPASIRGDVAPHKFNLEHYKSNLQKQNKLSKIPQASSVKALPHYDLGTILNEPKTSKTIKSSVSTREIPKLSGIKGDIPRLKTPENTKRDLSSPRKMAKEAPIITPSMKTPIKKKKESRYSNVV